MFQPLIFQGVLIAFCQSMSTPRVFQSIGHFQESIPSGKVCTLVASWLSHCLMEVQGSKHHHLFPSRDRMEVRGFLLLVSKEIRRPFLWFFCTLSDFRKELLLMSCVSNETSVRCHPPTLRMSPQMQRVFGFWNTVWLQKNPASATFRMAVLQGFGSQDVRWVQQFLCAKSGLAPPIWVELAAMQEETRSVFPKRFWSLVASRSRFSTAQGLTLFFSLCR